MGLLKSASGSNPASTRPVRRCVILLLGFTTVTGATVERASAQATGRIIGEVVAEDSGQPIDAAAVTLRDGSGANTLRVTSSNGGFEFVVPSGGTYELRISHLGYMQRDTTIRVLNATMKVIVAMSREPVSIEPISVDVRGFRSAALTATGFYDRMQQGWGAFFEPGWIAENKAGFPQLGSFTTTLVNRASTSCSPIRIPVYLDRRRVNYPSEAQYTINQLSVADVAAAEVYPATAPLPLWAFNDTTLACGAVILWSTGTMDQPIAVRTVEVELCDAEKKEGEVTLEGTVRDALTGVPLPTARVRIQSTDNRFGTRTSPGEEVLADSIGRYRLCNVPVDAEVVLTPSYGRRLGADSRITAVRDQIVPLVIEVTVAGSIVGRVVNELTGRGLRAASVVLVGTDYETTSDSFGRFSFDEIPAGLYEVQVSCPKFGSGDLSIRVPGGGRANATLRLSPAERTGRIDCAQ